MRFFYPLAKHIEKSAFKLLNFAQMTPLEYNKRLSEKSCANIWVKREDCGPVGSYKWRGSANWFFNNEKSKHVVTCSAGNHAQGVAFAANRLGLQADIFMPKITTRQKINKVAYLGNKNAKIFLEGFDFDESNDLAIKHALAKKLDFIHPFDDKSVIEGQGTVGYEILEQMKESFIDYVIVPIGGGGLAAGLSSYFHQMSPHTKIIGVQPFDAPSMFKSMEKGTIVTLDSINTFVDGASVKKPGTYNFPICSAFLHKILLIDSGQVCSKIIQMYNEHSMIVEPAGALSLCALDKLALCGKTVVCVISGRNSDASRMPEILERANKYENGHK
jgi:threonine dehydratase